MSQDEDKGDRPASAFKARYDARKQKAGGSVPQSGIAAMGEPPPRAKEVGPTLLYTRAQLLGGAPMPEPDHQDVDLPTILGIPPTIDKGQDAARWPFEVLRELPPVLGQCPRFLATDQDTSEQVELRELNAYGTRWPRSRSQLLSLMEHVERGGALPEWASVPGTLRLLRVVPDSHRGPIAVLDGDGAVDLSAHMRAHKISRREALQIGAEVARQLAGLHAVGFVHGRVSAPYVFLDDRGQPHLEVLTSVLVPDGATSQGAPETRARHDPGPAADVYACAVLTLTCMGGEVMSGEARGVPEDLARKLSPFLSKEPSSRPDAGVLVEVLGRLLAPAPPGKGVQPRVLLAALGLGSLLLGSVCFVAIRLWIAPEPTCPYHARIEAAAAGGDVLCAAYWAKQCSAFGADYQARFQEVRHSELYVVAEREARRKLKVDSDGPEYIRILALLHEFVPSDPLVQYRYQAHRANMPAQPCR
jgi:hypothetical protein